MKSFTFLFITLLLSLTLIFSLAMSRKSLGISGFQFFFQFPFFKQKTQEETYEKIIDINYKKEDILPSGTKPRMEIQISSNTVEPIDVLFYLFNLDGLKVDSTDCGSKDEIKCSATLVNKGDMEEFSIEFEPLTVKFRESFVINGYVEYKMKGWRKMEVPVTSSYQQPSRSIDISEQPKGPVNVEMTISPREWMIRGEPSNLVIKFQLLDERFPVIVKNIKLKFYNLEISPGGVCDFDEDGNAKKDLNLPYEDTLVCLVQPKETASDMETIEVSFEYDYREYISKKFIIEPLYVKRYITYWFKGTFTNGTVTKDFEADCPYRSGCKIFPGMETTTYVRVNTEDISGKCRATLYVGYEYEATSKNEIMFVNENFVKNKFGGSADEFIDLLEHPIGEIGAGPVNARFSFSKGYFDENDLKDGNKITVYISLDNINTNRLVWPLNVSVKILKPDDISIDTFSCGFPSIDVYSEGRGNTWSFDIAKDRKVTDLMFKGNRENFVVCYLKLKDNLEEPMISIPIEFSLYYGYVQEIKWDLEPG